MGSDASLSRTDTTKPDLVAPSVDTLLALALSRPAVARAAAEDVLHRRPSPADASIAYQTLAIVDRDDGHVSAALQEARTALRYARISGPDRYSDVLGTLGATLVIGGRTKEGLRKLDQAEQLAHPGDRPRIRLRRANMLYYVGRFDDALKEVDAAIKGSRVSSDDLWMARGLNTRCLIGLALGDVAAADRDAASAALVLGALGQQLESAFATHNQALAALQGGRLVDALSLLEEVAQRYATIGSIPTDLVIDRAQALLTAGLVVEARSMLTEALQTDLQPIKRAEILLTAARAALAYGDVHSARQEAGTAGRLFKTQQRPRWSQRAKLLALQAQFLTIESNGNPSNTQASLEANAEDRQRRRRILRQAADLASHLEERAPEWAVGQLLHGRISHAAGHNQEAEASWKRAAGARRSGSSLDRAAGWLAAALLADLQDNRRALLHACLRGLDAVDEHRALMGDLELRALASRHGNELATLAFRSKVAEGDTRGMLWWIERWRATGLSATPVKPSVDADLERHLAALRDVTRRLETLTDSDPLAPLLRQERDRREAAVRGAYRRQRGRGALGPRFDLKKVLETLGDRQMVALLQDDDLLYTVLLHDGRVRRRQVLSTPDALREAQFARFSLRRAAYGRLPDLDGIGMRLRTALLGAVGDLAGDGHTVIVPPSTLLTAPWALLPVLRHRTFTVVPSATMWAAASAQPAESGPVALITGPGLSTGESEVTALSPLHGDARSASGEEATVARALELLEGAGLAHIAAHGTFRADAPLFSSLRLADGPLTVHDLQRLERPPRAMVLSACDSGDAAPIGENEALGLVTSLLAMGTSAVVASVVPVNDRATVGVMRQLHQVVGQGGSLAEGMRVARQEAAGDPLLAATAAAFTVWGA